MFAFPYPASICYLFHYVMLCTVDQILRIDVIMLGVKCDNLPILLEEKQGNKSSIEVELILDMGSLVVYKYSRMDESSFPTSVMEAGFIYYFVWLFTPLLDLFNHVFITNTSLICMPRMMNCYTGSVNQSMKKKTQSA